MPSPPSHTLNAALTAACAELAAAAQAMDTGPARDCLRGAEVIAITDPLDGLYAPADFLAAVKPPASDVPAPSTSPPTVPPTPPPVPPPPRSYILPCTPNLARAPNPPRTPNPAIPWANQRDALSPPSAPFMTDPPVCPTRSPPRPLTVDPDEVDDYLDPQPFMPPARLPRLSRSARQARAAQSPRSLFPADPPVLPPAAPSRLPLPSPCTPSRRPTHPLTAHHTALPAPTSFKPVPPPPVPPRPAVPPSPGVPAYSPPMCSPADAFPALTPQRHTPHDPYAPYRGPFARSLGSLLSKPSSTTTAVEPPPRPLPPTPSRALARLIGRRPGRTGPPTPARERAGSASAPVAGRLRAYMERI